MERIEELRSQIYDFFHASDECQKYFFADSRADQYAKYYTAMYLLQDSTEGLKFHMETGFNENSNLAYIELWGVMQAVIIQQDSIATLYKIFLSKKLVPDYTTKWKEIRVLRNQCAGHPGDQGGRFRSFFGRTGIHYDNLQYERKAKGAADPEYITVDYTQLVVDYVAEAVVYLEEIVEVLPSLWPSEQ